MTSLAILATVVGGAYLAGWSAIVVTVLLCGRTISTVWPAALAGIFTFTLWILGAPVVLYNLGIFRG